MRIHIPWRVKCFFVDMRKKYIDSNPSIFLFLLLKIKKSLRHQIVVIGDSHARFFSGSVWKHMSLIYTPKHVGGILYVYGPDKRFCTFQFRNALAYNLNKSNSTSRAREKYEYLAKSFLKPGDTIICAFGEIDCRLHVFKHVTDSFSYQDVVDEIIYNYSKFLRVLKDDGFRVVVWGPIGTQTDRVGNMEGFPHSGDEVGRNKATEYFNNRIKQICKENGYGFMTAFFDVVDENYRTKEEYIFDGCHLGQNARWILEKELKKIFISV